MSSLPTAAPVQVRTWALPEPAALLDALPAEGALAWVRDGDGLVGWGEAARLDVSGPNRFARAARWWEQWSAGVDAEDEVGGPGAGPVAFASFAFDDSPGRSVVVVPEVVVGRRNGTSWITTVGAAAATMPVRPAPKGPDGVRFGEGSRSEGEWRDAVVEAVRRISFGELDKVVLACDLVAHAKNAIDPRWLLERLALAYPACWAFSCDGLVGATPELLARRQGQELTSVVLAGTARRTGDPAADERAADALMASAKNRAEHAYTAASVADSLAPHCAVLDVPDTPDILRLANVLHLSTTITGRLHDPERGVTALDVAALLHPTAAVCGTPTETARRVISELEGMDRGRYAGPVGWVDSRGDGEFGIALRCAEVSGTTARLFAGCGIVSGSDPDAEIDEAHAKLVPMRDALGSG